MAAVMNELTAELNRRLERQLTLAARLRAARPEGRGPDYMAHMAIERDGRTDDILLGSRSRVEAGLSVLDWLRAPLAEVFFQHAEGEEYEVSAHGRTSRGRLLERNLVSFASGELIELRTPSSVVRRRGAAWTVEACPHPILSAPVAGGGGRRLPALQDLDPEQLKVVRLPAGEPALITGEAGSGKTTVALHRLAHLCRNAPASYRALVLLPSEPLRRVASSLLRAMGVRGLVEIRTFDEWAADQARRCFSDIPSREACDASAEVIRLKRHPALLPVLAELAGREPALPDPEGPRRHVRSNALAHHADLEHLFGDRVLMDRVADASGGVLGRRAVAEVLEHTHVQFSITSEEEYDFVDPDRLVALDRARLDEGTPLEDAASIDPEDYPVMFELDRLRCLGRNVRAVTPEAYDCIAIDEAQELSVLELRLAGRALGRGGTLVVSGDDAQQVDPTTSSFCGWDRIMAELGVPRHQHAALEVGYRSAPAIRALTRRIARRPPCPAGLPPDVATRVHLVEQPSECHLAAWLIDELRAREQWAPATSLAVILRDPAQAARFGRLLGHAVAVQSAAGDEVRSGACITSVPQVKGLELDTVVVVDASAVRYPDTPYDRRAMYVAASRARHQLILASAGPWSPMVTEALGQE